MWIPFVPDETHTNPSWDWYETLMTSQIRSSLYHIAYNILHHHQDAEDVVQEALIRGAMKIYQLKNQEKFFQWMYSIVTRMAYARRRQRMRALKQLIKAACPMGEEELTPDEFLIADQEKGWVHDTLADVDELDWRIIQMHIQQGLTHREIARELQMNYQTVRSRYRRVLESLKRRKEADT